MKFIKVMTILVNIVFLFGIGITSGINCSGIFGNTNVDDSVDLNGTQNQADAPADTQEPLYQKELEKISYNPEGSITARIKENGETITVPFNSKSSENDLATGDAVIFTVFQGDWSSVDFIYCKEGVVKGFYIYNNYEYTLLEVVRDSSGSFSGLNSYGLENLAELRPANGLYFVKNYKISSDWNTDGNNPTFFSNIHKINTEPSANYVINEEVIFSYSAYAENQDPFFEPDPNSYAENVTIKGFIKAGDEDFAVLNRTNSTNGFLAPLYDLKKK